MIMIKVHKTPNGEIVAMCDSDLVGRRFESKDLRIDISERFYKGIEIEDKAELLKLIKESRNLNIVGKESVDFAMKNNVIDRTNIIKIKKIPYAIKIML